MHCTNTLINNFDNIMCTYDVVHNGAMWMELAHTFLSEYYFRTLSLFHVTFGKTLYYAQKMTICNYRVLQKDTFVNRMCHGISSIHFIITL